VLDDVDTAQISRVEPQPICGHPVEGAIQIAARPELSDQFLDHLLLL
jgi:hypothetical protein